MRRLRLVVLVLIATWMPMVTWLLSAAREQPSMAYLPFVAQPVLEPFVLDWTGAEQDWAWLVEHFGDVQYSRGAGGPRLVQLQESQPDSPSVLEVYVVNNQGNPVGGAPVVRHFPGAPTLPVEFWHCGFTTGLWGTSKPENGAVEFGLGHGDYYWPPAGGTSTVWVLGPEPDGDCLSGLGMLAGSNHVHLRAWFEVR